MKKYQEIKSERAESLSSTRLQKIGEATGVVRLQCADIYIANWYRDCEYKKFSDFVKQNIKEISDSQAYKMVNAAKLEYWLEGRNAVGRYSISAMEELASLKNENKILDVWEHFKMSGMKEPTVTLIREISEQLWPKSMVKAVQQTNESRTRDSIKYSKGQIVKHFEALPKEEMPLVIAKLQSMISTS
ncbi:hypothetical protein D5018_20815 [Parashewanella curva]|uniref:Uncharacterized protein n=1 Tax=Parashewanella curva TaxID=2338552 RepID=A0A3L8PSH7_9GAMM|nr:hypothetical protein [Parashewanella curva]RLV57769.1 hypothetical protein D5018_20815 [Parashewanella curva]